MKRLIAMGLVISGLTATVQAQYPDMFYYKFNEGQGSQVVNFAIPGGSQFVPTFESGGQGTWTTGQVGGALDFAGLDRLLSNGPTNLFTDFTIECWMKTNFIVPNTCTSGCGLGRLWGDYSTATFRCYVGFYNPGVNHLGGGMAAVTGYPMQTAVAYATDGAWHHVALVYDSVAGSLTSYVDGLVDQVTIGVSPGGTGTNFQLGGVIGAGSPFNGAIDEFRWWSTARSPAQILSGMNTEFTPPSGLQAFFRSSKRSGTSPLLVQFSDESVSTALSGVTSWAWDFNNDGLIDSTLQNPCYVYAGPGPGPNGEHTVSLTVSDGANVSTQTLTNYITPGAAGFVLATCGAADVYLAAPPPPVGWSDGFTLVSTNPGGPAGFGWFFGLYPDSFTWSGLAFPPAPGNPFHFVNVGNPNLFPEATLVLGPNSVPTLVGQTLDAVVLYRDIFGNLLSATNVARVTF